MTSVWHGIVYGKTIEVTEDLAMWEGQAVDLLIVSRGSLEPRAEGGRPPTAPSARANRPLTPVGRYRGVVRLRTAGTNATAMLAPACTAAPASSVAGIPIAAPAGPASA